MKTIYDFSKSEILIYLKKKVKDKNIIILDQISFSKKEFTKNKNNILKKIKKKFFNEKVIIRSSGYNEDKKLSLAGKYNSFLNIDLKSPDLELSILELLKDYKDPRDKVFIQKYINEIDLAGVLFTSSVDTFSPYYVINCDYSKKTNLVTSGQYNPTMEVHNVYKYSKKKIPKKFSKLINIIKKIEKLFPNNLLDIEFAIKNKIYLFQCRSLNSKLKKIKKYNLDLEIEGISKKIKKIFLKNPTLIGKSSLLSNMADWNPAEMIGGKSSVFSSTLYMCLITNDIWAKQRAIYGYKDVRPNPLMINIGHYNYIDLRTDFNSFLPKSLNEKTSEKLIEFFLEKLKKKNFLHDKIEFKIVPTCYQSNLDVYLNKTLKKNEIYKYKKSLIELTSKIINPKYKIVQNEIKLIKKLEDESIKIFNSKLSEIQKIFLLINTCQKYGTLPFAGLARCAFISKKIINNLVDDKILKKSSSENFLASIKTIVNELNKDLIKLKENKIKKKLLYTKIWSFKTFYIFYFESFL